MQQQQYIKQNDTTGEIGKTFSGLINSKTLDQNGLSTNGKLFYISSNVMGARIVISDTNGTIIKSLSLDENVVGNLFLINSTAIIGNQIGSFPFIWNYETGNIQPLPFQTHHDISYNPETKTFMTISVETVFENNIRYLFDTLVEYDIHGNKIWQFNTSLVVNKELWDGSYINDLRDITHANSFDWKMDTGKIYLNLRNIDQILKIDYHSQSLEWSLGKFGDFTLIDENGLQTENLFHKAHDIKIIDENTLSLFDNRYRLSENNNLRSRVLEISFNEITKVAKISQYWVAPSNLYSSVWGSAQKLPNGNYIASFGSSSNPSIVEVNMTSGSEYILPATGSLYQSIFSYHDPYLQIKENNSFLINENNSIMVEIRSSGHFAEGEKTNLEVRGAFNRSIPVTLKDNWKVSIIEIKIPNLPIGDYNISISTLSGNFRSKGVNITFSLRSYYFKSLTSLELEHGTEYSSLFSGKFSGDTFLILNLNQSLYHNYSSWSGSPVSLDTLEFDIGLLNFSYELRNSSHLLEEGNTFVEIFPQNPPLIQILLNSLKFEWGTPIEIPLNITELSSYVVEVQNDGISWYEESYLQSDEIIQITLPQLFEGTHQFELSVTDKLSQSSTALLDIEIIPPHIPIIINRNQRQLDWGITEQIIYEVHGAETLTLFRNGEVIENQTSVTNIFTHDIEWRNDNWGLETYNITILAQNENSVRKFTQLIEVIAAIPDRFASSVVTSQTSWVDLQELSLGSPDGNSAIVEFGYENGRITLDMNTDVLDQEGDDLKIYATGGTYRVFVSTEPNRNFREIGRGTGTQTFDILDYQTIRFVQIEYLTGEFIQLDAVEGFNITSRDGFYPKLGYSKTIEISNDLSDIDLEFKITNIRGVKATILEDGVEIEQIDWDGENLRYLYVLVQSVDRANVTSIFEDITGNQVSISIIILRQFNFNPIVIISILLVVIAIPLIIKYRIKS